MERSARGLGRQSEPRRRRARHRAAGGLAVLCAALAACAPPAPPPPAPPLRIALEARPSSLDPHLQSETHAQIVLAQVYESLVAFDADLRLVPALAERWENPDDLLWRFHLRPGVVFHDGRPLTAKDVAASIDRARNHPASKIAGNLVAIAEARAVGELTVEVRTATPYPILLNKLVFLFIAPQGSPVEIVAPVGTGAYRFGGVAGDRLRLAAFDLYWRGAPDAAEVELVFVSEPEERLRRLRAGEVDLIAGLAPEDAAALAADPGFRVESHSSLSVSYLQMDVSVPPFSDPRVRRALDLALDRPALVTRMLGGQGEPVGQMVSPNVFGYAPDLAPVGRDLTAARRLLAEAGYGDGFAAVLEHRQGREIAPIADQLAEVGVRVTLRPRPWSEMYPRLHAGEVPFYFGSWVCIMGDASDLFDPKVHTRDLERGYGTSNSNRYTNPELDRLIEASGALLDMVQRREILQDGLRRLAEDRAFLPLFTSYELYGVRREIAWSPRQDGWIYAFETRR